MRQFGDGLQKLRGELGQPVQKTSTLPEASPAPAPPPAPAQTPADSPPATKSVTGWRELQEGSTEYRHGTGKASRSERLTQLRLRLSGTCIGESLDRTIAYARSEEFNTLLMNLARRLAAGGLTVAAFAVNLVIGLTGLIVVLYLVFLLLEFPEHARARKTSLPPQYRTLLAEFVERFSLALRTYFRGQAVVALITGVLFAIGFSIIGLPTATLFGLFVGLLNMVLHLQAVAFAPSLLLAAWRAIEGDSSFAMSVVLTVLVFSAVQLIQDTLVIPRVIGKATWLRPLAILLGLFMRGKLLGFPGLLPAIPLTCLGIAYYRRYVLRCAPQTQAPGTG